MKVSQFIHPKESESKLGLTDVGKKSGRIVVLFSVDERYYPMLAVTLKSILLAGQDPSTLRIFLLGPPNEKLLRSILDQDCALRNLDLTLLDANIGTLKGKVNQRGHLSTSMAQYGRLFMGRCLPLDVHKLIYLDCDLIVRRPLRQLWDMPMHDAIVLAAYDMIFWKNPPWNPELYRDLNVLPGSPYFNSGVLVVNMDQWRVNEIDEKAQALAVKYRGRFCTHDQCALNRALHGHWRPLPPAWNFHCLRADPSLREIYSCELIEEALFTPAIVHYVGPEKPWMKGGDYLRNRPFCQVLKTLPFLRETLLPRNRPERFYRLKSWVRFGERVCRLYESGLLKVKSPLKRALYRICSLVVNRPRRARSRPFPK